MARRTKAQILKARAQIAHWMLTRPDMTQTEMAERLGVSNATITRDKSAVITEWKESARQDISELKARQFAKFEKMEAELWEAWHKSCEQYTEKTRRVKAVAGKTEDYAVGPDGVLKKSKEPGDPKPIEVRSSEKHADRYGDPNIMARLQRCLDQQTELMGLAELRAGAGTGAARAIADALVSVSKKYDLSQYDHELELNGHANGHAE